MIEKFYKNVHCMYCFKLEVVIVVCVQFMRSGFTSKFLAYVSLFIKTAVAHSGVAIRADQPTDWRVHHRLWWVHESCVGWSRRISSEDQKSKEAGKNTSERWQHHSYSADWRWKHGIICLKLKELLPRTETKSKFWWNYFAADTSKNTNCLIVTVIISWF